jgi:hypothetical protein
MKCLLYCLLLCSFTSLAQVNIIPQPVSVKYSGMNGKFLLGPETKIILEGNGLENSISFLNDYLKPLMDLHWKPVQYQRIIIN